MEIDVQELIRLITEVRDEARADRKKCWREDIEEKAEFDGKVEAYNYCLQMIKNRGRKNKKRIMKEWKSFNDECSRCGNNPVEVFTDAKEDYAYDGDNVECFECGLSGSVSVDEDDDGIGVAHVVWDDYEDED